MLATRSPGATACPSEVARALAAGMPEGEWRGMMPVVHDAIDALLAEGRVRLTWKGKALSTRSGSYRISLATSAPPE
ncbi:DUF3253 domain-containing protein [Sphingomonas solaris]|uniref:DUF3253 domain-containing protein n=1 Tax=Alterirhizorhabdus solaris TaxID=2529389 RepID=A0A558R7Q7_9SPHN|nr:DUF3253 domain-containing protein [Sphingomonas solaris]TVV75386.1 DUF3253 domain-containing protein [Sphingomonas solaris]